MNNLFADFRYAARGLRKNPGFTIVAALTMALGIGATTAIFSVVNAVLLRPLPYRDPGRLTTIWTVSEKTHDDSVVSYPLFQAWKQQSQSFAAMAAWDGNSAQMTVAGEPTELPGAEVSPGFFDVFQVHPILGRIFAPEEHRNKAGNVIMLSYKLWQRLGADRNIANTKITLGKANFTVVGVMPRGFEYPPDSSTLWFPHATDDSRNNGPYYLKVVGRMKPGVAVGRALNELKTVTAHLPDAKDGVSANVVPLTDHLIGESRRVLWVLMGAVACVFLIACANVANLLLVRASGRARDLSIRVALGANRWQIVRSLLAESVLLSCIGAVVGITAAFCLVRAFVAIDPVHLPRIQEVSVDSTVLLWAVVATLLCGAASRPAQQRSLRLGRSVTCPTQIALAVMLLVSAGLMMRSFLARVSVPLGFRPEGVIGVELPYSSNRRIHELLDRLRTLPGVRAAGASTTLPQNLAPLSCQGCVGVEGKTPVQGGGDDTGLIVATPGYFEAAGMTLRRGRFFTAADGAEAPKVAILNEAMARREFGDLDPIGRHVRWGSKEWSTVVGVVGNVKGFGSSDSRSNIYFARGQVGWYNPVAVMVRTAVPPKSLVAAVRKEIRSWNANLLIKKVDTEDSLLASSVAAPRFYLWLVAGFAILALTISAIGVYGTVNYSVARRTHEIGIRIALGAERGNVLSMILRDGLTMTAIGLVLGLAGAWASTRLLESILFGIRPTDAVAFACGSGVLLLAVLFACYIPARRATRVDPLVALRHE